METVTTSATAAPIAADRREAGEEEAEDGDDDGGAGEQHGLAGGGDGGAGGVGDAHALVEVLAVSGDDEQRVVDADAEADHGAQDQRELGDVQECGQDADGGGTDEDAHQRGDDRQAHGHHGAEGDEQHDDGDADTDQLAARGVLCQLGECAGELDLRRRSAPASSVTATASSSWVVVSLSRS